MIGICLISAFTIVFFSWLITSSGRVLVSETSMDNPLGKKVGLPTSYDPSVLFSIYRSEQRSQLDGFKYSGYDAWNIHELLWLDHDNNVHHDEICIKIDANSVAIPESKSMKLF